MKSSPGQQPKFTLLGTERLHAPHVGGHQAYGGVEDAAIEGIEVALLNEQGADFLQSHRVVRPCVNSCAFVTRPSPDRRCSREVSETFDECMAVCESQPALLHVQEAGFRGRVCSRFRLLPRISSILVTRPKLLA